MISLDESFAHCRRVSKTRAKNFYYSFVLLSREQKDAMCAVYAFMRYSDDISDKGDPPVEVRREALNRWRKALTQALAGNVGDDEALAEVYDILSRQRLTKGRGATAAA